VRGEDDQRDHEERRLGGQRLPLGPERERQEEDGGDGKRGHGAGERDGETSGETGEKERRGMDRAHRGAGWRETIGLGRAGHRIAFPLGLEGSADVRHPT
jgi:hypothetical protein